MEPAATDDRIGSPSLPVAQKFGRPPSRLRFAIDRGRSTHLKANRLENLPTPLFVYWGAKVRSLSYDQNLWCMYLSHAAGCSYVKGGPFAFDS